MYALLPDVYCILSRQPAGLPYTESGRLRYTVSTSNIISICHQLCKDAFRSFCLICCHSSHSIHFYNVYAFPVALLFPAAAVLPASFSTSSAASAALLPVSSAASVLLTITSPLMASIWQVSVPVPSIQYSSLCCSPFLSFIRGSSDPVSSFFVHVLLCRHFVSGTGSGIIWFLPH